MCFFPFSLWKKHLLGVSFKQCLVILTWVFSHHPTMGRSYLQRIRTFQAIKIPKTDRNRTFSYIYQVLYHMIANMLGNKKNHGKINPNKAWPSGFPYPNRTSIPTIPSIPKQPRIGVSPVPPWSSCFPIWTILKSSFIINKYIYILNGNNNNNNLKWHLPRLWLS